MFILWLEPLTVTKLQTMTTAPLGMIPYWSKLEACNQHLVWQL